jgi:hypothetical protein
MAEDQVFCTDDLKMAKFLMARGCTVRDSKLREDGRRIDFYLGGDETFILVQEFRRHSPATLSPTHAENSALEHLRDICSRLKQESKRSFGGKA